MPRPSQQIDQALLASGRELLPALGCAGLSVRAVAAHAGVAPGMFHYHFGSKREFLRTLLSGLYEEMFSALAATSVSNTRHIEEQIRNERLTPMTAGT